MSFQVPIITQRSEPRELSACANTLQAAFVNDPVLRYTLSRNTSQPSKSDSLISDDLVTSLLFETAVAAGHTAHGIVRIARLFYHCGMPIAWWLVSTFPARVKALKSAAFSRREIDRLDFYYIYFLATRPDAQGLGLGTAWLRQCQDEATRARKPIWLESSTEKSRRF
ncbi:hypothetical protein DV735_g3994, partial [Chaetothyriales sp. CBS 134920]